MCLLRVIIRVINFELEFLALFEVEVDEDLLDPLRVQVVMDDLGFADLSPSVTRIQLVNDNEGIRFRESVHIRQCYSLEGQR